MRGARRAPVLEDAGKACCVLGNVAIARGAIEAGVQFFSCYPGTPSSEIADTIAGVAGEAGVRFEYSINETVAVEIAFAASLAGARSMCSMKHVGLGYAMDPAANMPYVGIRGGMLIVSAGDPSLITSSNEADHRHLTRMLFYPIFDPSTPQDALRMVRYAFDLSEATRLPAILRPTTRVCHSSAMVEFGLLPAKRNPIRFEKDPASHVPIPVNARRMRLELSRRYAQAAEMLLGSGFFPREGNGRKGILASGVACAYARQAIAELGVADRITLQQIGAYPIPETVLVDFLSKVDSVLVIEELTPFVEDWVTLAAYRNKARLAILGKHSGHFPMEFEYDPELVGDVLRGFLGMTPCKNARAAHAPSETEPGRPSNLDRAPAPLSLPARPPVLCPGCPHRASFYLARRVFGKETVYVNDIGCYTLGYGQPLDSCDVLLSMGSSIAQASGLARMTGKRTLAYIGDSTFFHSGLPGLANALQKNDEITIVILNNYVTAMTGFQPSPTSLDKTGLVAHGGAATPRAFSIEAAARGLGVQEVLSVDPFDEAATLAAFKRAKAGRGVNVVVCNSPCVVHEARSRAYEPRPPYEIDPAKCTECSLCVRLLGCPAIHIVGGKYSIDPALCCGCHLCAWVCKKDAIQPGRPSRALV